MICTDDIEDEIAALKDRKSDLPRGRQFDDLRSALAAQIAVLEHELTETQIEQRWSHEEETLRAAMRAFNWREGVEPLPPSAE